MTQQLLRLFGGDAIWMAVVTFLFIFASFLRRDARKDRDLEAYIQELEHAQDIQRRLDRARRDRRDGMRPHADRGYRD
ncbi:MAG: hypothetical protein AAF755_10275 [Pseudomonadota bacterium]